MTNPTPLITKRSSELRAGDVVVEHGHRLVLVGEPHTFTNGSMGDLVGYSWHGEPVDGIVNPDGDEWVARWITHDGYWTVQGNDLVTWAVEAR